MLLQMGRPAQGSCNKHFHRCDFLFFGRVIYYMYFFGPGSVKVGGAGQLVLILCWVFFNWPSHLFSTHFQTS